MITAHWSYWLLAAGLFNASPSVAQTYQEYFSHYRTHSVVVRGHPDLPLSLATQQLYYERAVQVQLAADIPKQQFYEQALEWARAVTPANRIQAHLMPNGVTRVEISVTDPFRYQVQTATVATHMSYHITVGVMDGAFWFYATDFRLVNTQLPEGDPHKYIPLETYLVPTQNADKDPALVAAVRDAFYEGLGFMGLLEGALNTPLRLKGRVR